MTGRSPLEILVWFLVVVAIIVVLFKYLLPTVFG